MDEAKVTYTAVPFSAPGILVSGVAWASARWTREAVGGASACGVSFEDLVTRRNACAHPPSVNPISVRLGDSMSLHWSNLLN